MKKILVILWAFPVLAFASSATDEFQAALAEAGKGIPIKPQISSFGDPITADFKEVFRMLPPEKKEKLATQITPLLPRLAQEESDSSIRNAFGSLDGILIVKEIGTDEQKVQAFRDLDLFEKSLGEACRALATCEGVEGVKVLKKYAESQFPGIDSEFSQSKNGADQERYASQNPPSLKLYQSVIALSGAYHSDGPVAAEKLRDQLINLSKEHLNASQLAELKKEFDKDMKKARHERESLLREKRPNNKRNSKAGNMTTEASGTIADSSSRVINSKWFWPSTAALLLVLAYWFIGKRRI
jgi:hypothetical protein